VIFVDFFERRKKPWMNGRVRSLKLQLDWTLMTLVSHIGVTDPCIARKDYIMHGLHVNSQGKKKKKMFTQLTAERVVGCYASGTSRITVVINSRDYSFFSLNSKA
jgi:hypothetical protein